MRLIQQHIEIIDVKCKQSRSIPAHYDPTAALCERRDATIGDSDIYRKTCRTVVHHSAVMTQVDDNVRLQ